MPTTIILYIQMGFLAISLISNGWQYVRNVSFQKSLMTCESNLSLQNQAIANIRILQNKIDQYQSQISTLAAGRLQAQSQTYAQLQAPDECVAAIHWGITQAQEFKQ